MIAGKRKGFEDTRGTLFFEIARFASILRTRYLFLENVKGLLNHERGATFETIIRTLDELGYDMEWQLFNSKNYVAQNRERVFIIGHFLSQEKKNQLQFIIRMFITKRSMLYYFRSKFMTVATQGVMLMCIFLLRRRE